MNKILKKTLLHYIDLDMYANAVIEAMMEEYDLCYTECAEILLSSDYYKTKADYSNTYNAIKESVTQFTDKLDKRMSEEAETVTNLELEFLKQTYKGILTVGAVSFAKTMFMPIGGIDTTKMFVERTTKNILRSYDTALRSGYLFGQSSADVKQNVDKALNQTIRGMKNGIQSAIPSYAKSTDKIVFLNNDKEVVWVATLDGRTCITCASMNGLRYKSAAEAPSTPHFKCRCILQIADILYEPIPEFKDFIEELSDEDQRHVLGVNRYKLWKEYNVPLEKFLDNGEVILLKDLKKSLNIKDI